MAIMQRSFVSPPAHAHVAGDSSPLRRCTFRRVTTLPQRRELPLYEVACTFPDRRRAVILGDIESARPICGACTYQGIFRPDSD